MRGARHGPGQHADERQRPGLRRRRGRYRPSSSLSPSLTGDHIAPAGWPAGQGSDDDHAGRESQRESGEHALACSTSESSPAIRARRSSRSAARPAPSSVRAARAESARRRRDASVRPIAPDKIQAEAPGADRQLHSGEMERSFRALVTDERPGLVDRQREGRQPCARQRHRRGQDHRHPRQRRAGHATARFTRLAPDSRFTACPFTIHG